MTWEECKLASLQKLFSAGATIDTDEATEDYIAAIPQAVNEAITKIVAVKPLRKDCEIDYKAEDKVYGFDLNEYIADYKNSDNLEVYFIGEDGVPKPLHLATIIAGRFLTVPKINEDGTILFRYNAKPQRITADTENDYEFDLDDDCCALIPVYVGGELYKDDDLQIATYYMNEFEQGLSMLVKGDQGIVTDEFYSESGW